ncbi:MAG: YdcF family protein [Patescibacteria group bacterium]|nr:YdcF family protein [Patescibacteria group bacterium]MDD5294878.1 YdcF family protein [Patescibacteria group bacterium]MDD5554642.1 YdcF family protein [Patescibacteria group bacterium]
MENKELEKVKIMAIVSNDKIKKSEAVVCLEGDVYHRLDKAVKIFKQGLAERLLISGGYNSPPFSIPAKIMAKKIPASISRRKIILEENSQNSYEQGVEVMKIAKEKKWKKIILVASNFHQPRAYLTFLKTMEKAKLKIQIFNAPARELLWFEKTTLGKTRMKLLEEEFEKIDKYTAEGYLATTEEAINYQKWKEKQK